MSRCLCTVYSLFIGKRTAFGNAETESSSASGATALAQHAQRRFGCFVISAITAPYLLDRLRDAEHGGRADRSEITAVERGRISGT